MPDTRSRSASATSEVAANDEDFVTPTPSPDASPNASPSRGRGPLPNSPIIGYLQNIDKKIEDAIARALDNQVTVLRQEILSAVETRLKTVRDEIYDDLNGKLERLSKRVDRLQNENGLLKTELELRSEMVDTNVDNIEDLEQYGRRMALRIANVPFSGEREEDADLLATVKQKLSDVNTDIVLADHDVVRLHRVGDEKTDRSGKKCKNIIIKFSNWFARQRVISGFNKKAAAKKLPTRVFHDLTTSRFKLLNYARKEVAKRLESAGISEDMQKKLPDNAKMFAFVTPNCELRLRQNGRVHKFFSENQVDLLVSSYVPPRL